MFVKYCPDSTLAAVLKFKAPDKWTASEIQERIDCYQIEMKEQVLSKSKCTRSVTVHAQIAASDDSAAVRHTVESPVESENGAASKTFCDDNCLKTLVNLFDRALSQNNHAMSKSASFDRFQHQPCRVCKSSEHSTLAHCRQKRLCLACFEPNHIKRNCPNRQPSQGQRTSSPQNVQPLN